MTKDISNVKIEEETHIIPLKGGNRKDEIQSFLRSKYNDNSITFECKALGLLGFIKFTAGYYAILIEDADLVGKIMCHDIYEVRMCNLIKIFNSSSVKNSKRENRYYKDHIKKYLNNEKPSFFYSYTYDMTTKLQDNFIYSLKEKADYKLFYEGEGMPIFQWNNFPKKNFE
jgi:SacI homology domain